MTKDQLEAARIEAMHIGDWLWQGSRDGVAEQELLMACYRSGQITERQWQQHIEAGPKLRDAWLGTAPLGV